MSSVYDVPAFSGVLGQASDCGDSRPRLSAERSDATPVWNGHSCPLALTLTLPSQFKARCESSFQFQFSVRSSWSRGSLFLRTENRELPY
jgi:hypothetical protein